MRSQMLQAIRERNGIRFGDLVVTTFCHSDCIKRNYMERDIIQLLPLSFYTTQKIINPFLNKSKYSRPGANQGS